MEEQENALSEVVIGGSAVDSLNCSSVAIFMRPRCMCVCMHEVYCGNVQRDWWGRWA